MAGWLSKGSINYGDGYNEVCDSIEYDFEFAPDEWIRYQSCCMIRCGQDCYLPSVISLISQRLSVIAYQLALISYRLSVSTWWGTAKHQAPHDRADGSRADRVSCALIGLTDCMIREMCGMCCSVPGIRRGMGSRLAGLWMGYPITRWTSNLSS